MTLKKLLCVIVVVYLVFDTQKMNPKVVSNVNGCQCVSVKKQFVHPYVMEPNIDLGGLCDLGTLSLCLLSSYLHT